MTASDSPQRSTPRGAFSLTARGSGSWLLTLRERQPWAAGWVQQLESELLFPAGPSASPPTEPAFKRRRGRVRRADLHIDQAGLNRSLAAVLLRPEGLAVRGHFDLCRVYIDPDIGASSSSPTLLVLFRCRPEGGSDAEPTWGTARVAVRRPPSSAADLILGMSEVRLFGICRIPVPLLGHSLLRLIGAALIAHPPSELPSVGLFSGPAPLGLSLLSTPALSELRIELLHDALLEVLPRAGYRAADPSTSPLFEISTQPGQLILRYAAEGQRGGLNFGDLDDRPRSNPAIEPVALVLGAPIPEALRIADQLLCIGDTGAAIAAYNLIESSLTQAGLARIRRLQVLATASERAAEATALAELLLLEPTAAIAAQLALASLALLRVQPIEAARRYHSIGSEPQSHPIERATALFSAARHFGKESSDAAKSALTNAAALLTPGGIEEPLLEAVRNLQHELQRAITPLPNSATAGTSSPRLTAVTPPSSADLDLVRQRAQLEEPAQALLRIEAALASSPVADSEERSDGQRRLILYAAQLAAELGEIDRSRVLLGQAGPHPDALHQRVQLDWPELLQAEPNSAADLLSVLREMQKLGCARPEELRGLARLLTTRGEHAEAIAVQRQAGADLDELLAALEAAGRYKELIAALPIHAAGRPDTASLLYQQAASVAEQQLGDRALAAGFWQQAAERSTEEPSGVALLWYHAGRLWSELGENGRAYTTLQSAVELGGESLPRATLMLADLAYTLGDLDAAALYYRQAMAVGQRPLGQPRTSTSPLPPSGAPNPPPQAARARAYLRLAEIAHHHGDGQTEEQALAKAVEAGGGAQAWPALAGLFRAQGDTPRLGMALLAWADHRSGEARAALLKESAALVPPNLLGRVDEELIRLDADDEAVRDRQLERLERDERRDMRSLLAALRRDAERSQGPRRRRQARRLISLALKLSAHEALVDGWLMLLSDEGQHLAATDVDAAVRSFYVLQRALAAQTVPAGRLEALRNSLLTDGQLSAQLIQLDRQLAMLIEDERGARSQLLWRAAMLEELCGSTEAVVRRYLALCAISPGDSEALSRLRQLLRGLAQAGRAESALNMVDGELRRLGTSAPRAYGLRLALAELLLFLGRTAEALGQLELVLMREPEMGPAHALLGMLLGASSEPADLPRGLEHLLRAAYAPDVDSAEAGECALMAADMLATAGFTEPVDLFALRAEVPGSAGYVDRAVAGTFVAVPTDFLAPETPAADEAASPRSSAPMAGLPQLIGPAELLRHAAVLLPGDPRPLEAMLGLSFSRGDFSQTLESCDRLLALPRLANDPQERARIRVEKGHVLLRLEQKDAAEAMFRQSLQDAPESLTALRALRRLLCAPPSESLAGDSDVTPSDSARLSEALSLIQRELDLCPPSERGTLAGLWFDCGMLHAQLDDRVAAMSAWRRAGQLGSAEGWRQLAEGLAEQGNFLAAADAAGRATPLTPESERGPLLVRAADLALRADDEFRARDYLAQAMALGGASAEESEERLNDLDGGPELEKRRRTLERRLRQTGAGLERLELLRRLLLVCCELYERSSMAAYATALLREAPADPLALCVLAEDAIERGQPDSAVEFLLQAVPANADSTGTAPAQATVPSIPPSYPRATKLLACLGEVHERKGHAEAATAAYQRLLELAERNGEIAMVEMAIEGLARIAEERGDLSTARRLLRRRLPHLPPDAGTARATIRLRIADLALALEDLTDARLQLNAVLEENPNQRSALVKLLEVDRQQKQPHDALRVLDRLLDLTMTPGERAEWLYARGELCENALGDVEQAANLYEQVLQQWPAHTRALRRTIVLAVRRGDGARVAAAVAALAKAGSPLADAQVYAGMGLLLVDNAAEALPLLRTASAADLATALSAIGLGPANDLRRLDGPLTGVLRLLDGNPAPLLSALRAKMQSAQKAGSFELSTCRVLARLCELRSLPAQSLYLSMLAFVNPGGYADERLAELGALPVPEVALEGALLSVRPMPAEQAPWLVAMGLFGRHVLGLPAPALPLAPEWSARLGELARSLGLGDIEVALVDTLADEPGACDPTRPPRLRLLRALTSDEAQARFAALRALHLLKAGISLGERGGALDLAALLQAAAALWLEPTESPLEGPPRADALESTTPAAKDWLATLRTLSLHPEQAPAVIYEARAETAALSTCLGILREKPAQLVELWPGLLATARLEASVRALGQLGDLRAALCALGRSAQNAEERLTALGNGPLADLLAVATRLYEAQ